MVSQFLSDMGQMIDNAEQDQELDLGGDFQMNQEIPNRGSAAPANGQMGTIVAPADRNSGRGQGSQRYNG